ncbi:hypothetical protein D6B98_11830 [Bradyrhizobium sp. LVM 105]|uniref:Uncharacterized protein n=1 Tax=Bradyrhizobium frederickii TaxID=2560054 RepID=A0A4Y9LDW3_9BRAD|nr:hypothetical protein D6B98_11830 [Bradyrhizobium sp. LVM 105]TFV40173.1 hypothetical protein E4K66_11295 [Bradyrhizobium frederickii]
MRRGICISLLVIPGRLVEPNPESRDSGLDASHRPGMTPPKKDARGRWLRDRQPRALTEESGGSSLKRRW